MVGVGSGPRSVGCTWSRASHSARFGGGRGCIATRSAGRSTEASRRSIAGRRRGRSSIRSRTRSTGCCTRIPGCRAFGSASCSRRWAARHRRRSSMTTCARSGRCSCPRRGRFSGRSMAGRDLPVRRVAPARGDPRRPRSDAARLGRRRVSGVLARGRWRAGVLDADRGSARRDRRVPGAPRRAASDAGLGPPSGRSRPRRSAVGGVRRVLRPAAGRLALLRAGRSTGQGRRRAAAGLCRDQLRARPPVRQRA